MERAETKIRSSAMLASPRAASGPAAAMPPDPGVDTTMSRSGYKNPNMISMLKTGDAKVPLGKIPALARGLRVDPALLFRLALEQYWPKKNKVVAEIFGTVLTANEIVMIKTIRRVSKGSDPAVTEKHKRTLERLFETTPY